MGLLTDFANGILVMAVILLSLSIVTCLVQAYTWLIPFFPEILKRFNKEIQEHHVYVMNKDIMNPKDMLKKGVKLAGKTEAYVKDA